MLIENIKSSGEKLKKNPVVDSFSQESDKSLFFRIIVQGIVMCLVLFVGFMGMNMLIASKEEPPKRNSFKTVYTVDSITVEKGTFQPSFLVYGEVQAAKSVELRPLVTGKIIDVNSAVQVGAIVEKDAFLFRIDPFNYEISKQSAISNIEETEARIVENEAMITAEQSSLKNLKDQLKFAQNDFDRMAQLKERGTATVKELDDRSLVLSQRRQALEQSELNIIAQRSRVEQLRSVLARHEQSLKQAERNLQDTELRAPFTGVISQNNAAVGRFIGSSDVTISMYRADHLEVRFTLTDQRFGRILSDANGLVGRDVEILWDVGTEKTSFPATIERLGAQITSSRGGIEVIARIKGDTSGTVLRPGAFVEVIVPDKTFIDHFKIPETAVYEGKQVYVIEEGKLQAKDIQIRAYDNNDVIISGNLETGAQILTTRIAEVSNGLLVKSKSQGEAQSDEEK